MKKFKKKLGLFFKKHFVKFLIGLAVILIGVGVVLLLRQVEKELETYTVEDASMYQYFGTQKFMYDTSLTISNEKEITELKVNDEVVELDSDPFYYQKEKKVIFPRDMSVVFPKSNGLQRKIPYFTVLDGTGIDNYLTNRGLNYLIENAFLYDGNDLYFFLDEVTIQLPDGRTIPLSPYSYLVLNYNVELMAYDYKNDSALVEENIVGDVFVLGDGYQLNVSIDGIIYGENTRLLMKNLNYLDNLS